MSTSFAKPPSRRTLADLRDGSDIDNRDDAVTAFVWLRLGQPFADLDFEEKRHLIHVVCPVEAAGAIRDVLLGHSRLLDVLYYPPSARETLTQLQRRSMVLVASSDETLELPPDIRIDFTYTVKDAEDLFCAAYGISLGLGLPDLDDLRDVLLTTEDPQLAHDRLRRIAAAPEPKKAASGNRRSDAIVHTSGAKDKVETPPPQDVSPHVELHRPSSPRISELSGYGKAGNWARDLVRDIADVRSGKLDPIEMDRGALVYGPPGTGKTLLVRAIAAEAGIPMVLGGYSIWLDSKQARGDVAIRMIRESFRTARENAPSILFIDEIDTFGVRGANGTNDSWFRPFVTTLLTEIDGAMSTPGVVVMAATNDPDSVDPALKRAGRLDRSFAIGMPDEHGLFGILGHHFGDADDDTLGTVAAALAGSVTGADIARLAREVHGRARRDRTEVTADLLIQSALPQDDRSDADLWRVAVHEAGHAILHATCGNVPESLSILPNGQFGGGVRIAGKVSTMPGAVDRHVLMLLGGRAAEEVVLGRCSAGASADLDEATRLLSGDEASGMGAWLTAGQVSHEAIERRMRRLYAEAVMRIIAKRKAVEDLARLAVRKRVLSKCVLEEFVGGLDLT
ncbi:AAA family ATPase [Notoacmeibacter ruber]|uniref:AAA family ATPase n=1 Tax=Notoacmeibacter ruber TaxID=2670375 RepID=A0A3L7J9T4_9HYPH|nr:AAA family ATPase [Notoacmeibacter ruber]RLQ87376.1 AAA family ATPase [Notoacmeibacter ruber]